MERTPLTAQTLARIIEQKNMSQSDLASRTGQENSQVSYHLTRKRPIRSTHLALYCDLFGDAEKRQLFASWIKDTFSADTVESLFVGDGGFNLNDQLVKYGVTLRPETQAVLEWLGEQMQTDSEMEMVVVMLAKRWGYKAKEAPRAPRGA